mmetsp:Transcript_1040/g.2941  ORF Transcript_1040/g.2941 Transcript_1040/m.2941 type:complete len:282 (-) Transcript_1040:407-1252(-)
MRHLECSFIRAYRLRSRLHTSSAVAYRHASMSMAIVNPPPAIAVAEATRSPSRRRSCTVLTVMGDISYANATPAAPVSPSAPKPGDSPVRASMPRACLGTASVRSLTAYSYASSGASSHQATRVVGTTEAQYTRTTSASGIVSTNVVRSSAPSRKLLPCPKPNRSMACVVFVMASACMPVPAPGPLRTMKWSWPAQRSTVAYPRTRQPPCASLRSAGPVCSPLHWGVSRQPPTTPRARRNSRTASHELQHALSSGRTGGVGSWGQGRHSTPNTTALARRGK